MYVDYNMDIDKIKKKLRSFSKDRDWDKYHNPKNLVMALSGEIGELVEIFQWLDEEQSIKIKSTSEIQSIKEELADIFIYLIRLADKLDIDIEESVEQKLKINAEKYPVALSKGNAVKYNKRK